MRVGCPRRMLVVVDNQVAVTLHDASCASADRVRRPEWPAMLVQHEVAVVLHYGYERTIVACYLLAAMQRMIMMQRVVE